MTERPELFWGMIASMWIGNLLLVILNLPLIGIWVRLLTVPYRLLYPAILVLCCIGIYSLNNSVFDVGLAVLFGFLGYVFIKLQCEPAPLLLGFVLGPMLEENLRKAMTISRGDPSRVRHAPDQPRACCLAACCCCWSCRAGGAPQARRSLSGALSMSRFRLGLSLPLAAHAGARGQRRRHLAAARRAGRPAHAAQGRQRGRRHRRHRDHADGGRADDERHRLATPSRWSGTAARLHGLERLRSFAGGVDAGALRRPRAACRSSAGTRSRCRARCPPGSRCRSASASSRSPTCSSRRSSYARAGFLVSPTVARQWAAQIERFAGQPGFRRGLPAAGPRAARRRAVSAFRRRRARWRRSPQRAVNRSIAARWPRRSPPPAARRAAR